MSCTSRLQIGDMGYYTCQLAANHVGDHSYEHKPEECGFPIRPFSIKWEQIPELDFIFTVEHLKQTNLDEVIDYIKHNFNISTVDYNFIDDSLHGAVPHIWLNIEYSKTSGNLDEYYYHKMNMVESKIIKYIEDSLVYDNKPISRKILEVIINIY